MFVLAPLALFVATAAALKSKVKPGSVPARQLNYAPGLQLNKQVVPETQTEFQYLNEKTEEFLVNGTNFPEVPFDIGESYAGLLNNTPHGESALFFWFFPSTNPDASDEITIWLNGGPGCSSLVGFLQENGRFLWQPGTYEPVSNPFAWDRLTNMVYVDQPAGTGLSPGPSTVKNESDVSNQFNDFWRRFIDTFDMHGYKIYFAGESYAGQYIPYMASGMLNSVDNKYFNLKGIQINDPSMNEDNVMIYAPSVATLNRYSNFFSLNDTFMSEINERAEKCGYSKFMNEAMSFPPPEDFPVAPDSSEEGCAVFDDIVSAATFINPCFNIYHVPDTCPYLWNLVGFPSMAGGPNNYFNRSDVQEALNVPPTDYWVCNGNIFPNGDGSIPSALGPLPSVIERTNNVVIGHGWYDYLLFVNGSLVTIQNMTWNGAQGFQKPPVEPLVLPITEKLNEHVNDESEIPYFWNAGAGILGTAHTERGLTFSTVNTAGHQIPQYSPGAAYRQLEFLLGRVSSLQDGAPYTGMQ